MPAPRSSEKQFEMPPPEAFVEMPGLRGLKLAHFKTKDGKSLDYVHATKDVVIPAMTHPSSETGRVLKGSVLFMQNGHAKTLRAGDTWSVSAREAQGPHVVLEPDTWLAVVRDGKSAYDV